jgi:predicted RNA-binding Zn-ribbon protein involved in translation (DUF1610 family)
MDEARTTPDDEYVEFVRAGARVAGEFECAACGTRYVATHYLPPCTNCGEKLWERSAWSPFGAQLAALSRN